MPELKIKCRDPESLKIFFQNMVKKELNLISNSIQRIEKPLL